MQNNPSKSTYWIVNILGKPGSHPGVNFINIQNMQYSTIEKLPSIHSCQQAILWADGHQTGNPIMSDLTKQPPKRKAVEKLHEQLNYSGSTIHCPQVLGDVPGFPVVDRGTHAMSISSLALLHLQKYFTLVPPVSTLNRAAEA